MGIKLRKSPKSQCGCAAQWETDVCWFSSQTIKHGVPAGVCPKAPFMSLLGSSTCMAPSHSIKRQPPACGESLEDLLLCSHICTEVVGGHLFIFNLNYTFTLHLNDLITAEGSFPAPRSSSQQNETSVFVFSIVLILYFCIRIPQVGTSTRMVTTEMMDTPSARPALGNLMDPRLQRATWLAAALTLSTTHASTQRMATA